MAIKVKKKTSRRDEAKAPDQIYTFNEKVFNYIEKNRVQLGIGLGVLLLCIVGFSVWRDSASSSSIEDGAELMEQTVLINSPIGEAPAGLEETRQSFETATERATAVREALAPWTGDDDVPVAAALADGASAVALREVGAAQVGYERAALAEDDRLGASLALQGVAAIQAETGDLQASAATLQSLAEAIPRLGPYSRYELARLTEAGGDFEAAHRLYREFIETDSVDLDVTELIEMAEHRADVLEVLLGIQAEANSDEAATEDDDVDDEG